MPKPSNYRLFAECFVLLLIIFTKFTIRFMLHFLPSYLDSCYLLLIYGIELAEAYQIEVENVIVDKREGLPNSIIFAPDLFLKSFGSSFKVLAKT